MTTEQLLFELRALDVRLYVDGERLRCSAPKGRITRELESRIAAHKPDLIRVLRATTPEPIPLSRRASPSSNWPLSFAQERFWFLQRLEPESRAYNITAHRHFGGHFDDAALRRAIARLQQRHEVLRASFPVSNGIPCQVIKEDAPSDLELFDLRGVTETEKKSATESLIHDLARYQFDLEQGGLFRSALIRLTEETQLLVLTLHHIICDGWSIGLLFHEIASLYQSYSLGDVQGLEDTPLQFGDFAAWERERINTTALNAQLEFWKKKLAGIPQQLELPVDQPRTLSAIHEAAVHAFRLDPDTSESLKNIAKQENCTQFMVLLAIFKALLSRYTGQSDIVVGTPVSTRTQPELEKLVGCFINTLVLRTELQKELSFRELLANVRATVLESLSHPDVPFEKLVSELSPERDLASSPLFQVAFVLQNTPNASEYEIVGAGAPFDLTLYMWESNGVIGGSIEYRTQLLDAKTVKHFGECYRTLASEAAAHPDEVLAKLPVVTKDQWKNGFQDCVGPILEYPADLCTHQWIDQQACVCPAQIAVLSGADKITYRELTDRSNRLARRLQCLGAERGKRVAILLDRSIDLVVSALAVWKSGCAYVPVDPQYPQARVASMVEDSSPTVIITTTGLSRTLLRAPLNVICLDREQQKIDRESAEPLGVQVSLEDLAYVIYTSGSTGKPKGVEVRHRSLVNFLSSMQRHPGMEASDRLLAVTTFSFDIAGLELYLPLVCGAQLVLAKRDDIADGERLIRLLRDHAITVMQATPVTWRLLLKSGWRGASKFRVLCGGEALPRELADRLLSTGTEVWNLYGPTETTIWSTIERVESETGSIAIGRPIANTTVYVMDDSGLPVPAGAVGEICIGGDGLARGYLNDSTLTHRKFVDDPFKPHGRIYRTGDLGRLLPNGKLDCLGRRDSQVKLRGFRIELGEIEAALEKQPGVQQAAAVVRNQNSDGRLIVYVAMKPGAKIDSRVLRKALLSELPEYMVPVEFHRIEHFPLTPNDKLDRNALATLDYQENGTTQAVESYRGLDNKAGQTDPPQFDLSPSHHIEILMSEIWKEVLGVEEVCSSDDFFALGGNSFSAARIIAQIQTRFGVELPLRSIFIDSTVSSLSSHIFFDASTRSYLYTADLPAWNCLVPAQPRGTRTPLFVVAGYQNPDDTLMILSQLVPHLGPDQPVFGFRPRWVEGDGSRYESIGEAALEFLTELRRIQPKGPYLLAGHCVGGILTLSMAEELMRQGEEVKLLALIDSERPTKWRSLLANVDRARARSRHIAEVISEIASPSGRPRGSLIRDLIQKKFGLADRSAQEFYEMRVAYWHLLHSECPRHYAGRITLILNEERARQDPNFGWEGVAAGGLDIQRIPGDHSAMIALHAKEIASLLRKRMEDSFAESGEPLVFS